MKPSVAAGAVQIDSLRAVFRSRHKNSNTAIFQTCRVAGLVLEDRNPGLSAVFRCISDDVLARRRVDRRTNHQSIRVRDISRRENLKKRLVDARVTYLDISFD